MRARITRRRAGGTAAVGALLVATTAWWMSGAGPAARGVAPDPACPGALSAAVQAPLPPRAGLADHLVPVGPLPIGPVRASVCRYGVAKGERPPALVAGARLDAARTAEAAGWLDSVPVAPSVAAGCTGDAPLDVLTFGYADGPDVRVVLHHGGCPDVTNGVLVLPPTADLVSRLDELIPVAR